MVSLCLVVTGHSYSRIAAPEIEMRLGRYKCLVTYCQVIIW